MEVAVLSAVEHFIEVATRRSEGTCQAVILNYSGNLPGVIFVCLGLTSARVRPLGEKGKPVLTVDKWQGELSSGDISRVMILHSGARFAIARRVPARGTIGLGGEVKGVTTDGREEIRCLHSPYPDDYRYLCPHRHHRVLGTAMDNKFIGWRRAKLNGVLDTVALSSRGMPQNPWRAL